MSEPFLRSVDRDRWPSIHALMLAQQFPATPREFKDAEPEFQKALMYDICSFGDPVATVMFSQPQDGVVFMQVVAVPEWQRHWASPRVIDEIVFRAFECHGWRVLWAQPRQPSIRTSLLKAGFQAGTPLDVGCPILVLTPFGYLGKKGLKRDAL